MKALQIILIVILALGGLFLLIMPFLAGNIYLERKTEVQAPAEKVYRAVNSKEVFNVWFAWFQIDSLANYSSSEGIEGVGATTTWQSEHPQVGNNTMFIFENNENELVKTGMVFEAFADTSYADFILKETWNGTEATCTKKMEAKGVAKFFGLALEQLVGPLYEDGLANLKQFIEEDMEDLAAVKPDLQELDSAEVN